MSDPGERIEGLESRMAAIETAIEEDPDDQFRGHTAAQLLGVVGAILEGEILRANGELDAAIEVLDLPGIDPEWEKRSRRVSVFGWEPREF